jgi:uncharacterized lipoprotein YmbA
MGEADYRVVLHVQRFDSALDEAAALEAMWPLTRTKNGEPRTRRSRVRLPESGAGFPELIVAQAPALEAASREIAQTIRILQQQDIAAARSPARDGARA